MVAFRKVLFLITAAAAAADDFSVLKEAVHNLERRVETALDMFDARLARVEAQISPPPSKSRALLSIDGESSSQSTRIDRSSVTTEVLNVTTLHVNGQMYWHGQPVGFDLPTVTPTPSPTTMPSPEPSAKPSRFPVPNPTQFPTQQPTNSVERIALVQNGYALVGRAYGMSSQFHAVSTNWVSGSTINPDKCGTCTTDMKNSLWSTLSSNEVKLCYGAGQTNCASFTHNIGKSLSQIFSAHTAVTVTENWTFGSLRSALGISPSYNNVGGYFCGLNLAFGTNQGCNQVDPNSRSCGGNGDILRIGCIGDNGGGFAGCNGGPDDYGLGVGVSSCYDGGGCANVGCAYGSIHYRSDSSGEGAQFTNTAYFWVRL
jgi:hypothetical protein